MVLLLVFMQLTRDLFAIAKFLLLNEHDDEDEIRWLLSLHWWHHLVNATR